MGCGTGIPDWICDLRDLVNAEVNGVELASDPIGFVQMVILDLIVGGLLSLAGEFAAMIWTVMAEITNAFLDAGGALMRPFEIFAELILNGLEQWHLLMTDLAVSTGAFSPIMLIIGWAITAFAIASIIRLILEVIQWI